MKFKIPFLIFITFIVISCDNDNNDLRNSLENSDRIRVEDDLFSNAPNDDFEIIMASIAANNLNITIDSMVKIYL